MQTSNKEIRRLSRQNLVGHYSVPLLACLISSVILGIMSLPQGTGSDPMLLMLNGFFVMVSGILSGLFSAGFIRIHMGLARKENVITRMVFYGFRFHPGRYIGAAILTMLLFCIPSAIFTGALIYYETVGPTQISIPVLVGCSIVSLFLLLWLALRTSLTMYLLVDRDEMTSRQAISASFGLMKNRCFKLLGLWISLIPLYLLSILTFGLAFLWLSPFIEQAKVVFYFDVTNQIPE